MKLKLKIWRQSGESDKGRFAEYNLDNIDEHMSFLEMLDVLNESLVHKKEEPIAFESDCREGICGTCSLVINGRAHGPWKATTTCQLHMREYRDGDTIVIEPFRARSFPIIKDLVVNRSAFDRIIQAGGYISVATGQAQDGNDTLIGKDTAAKAFEAATCIGCGACVAACPNGSAMLFTSAKVSHLALLPQGRPEAARRVEGMIHQHDLEGFGRCSNIGACSAVCPKEISLSTIARTNREYNSAVFGSALEA